ncbi:unnamed protein product [Rhizophagus irregularis]|uniref:Alpha/beta-hydrolase n=1 Tax=Rhizophagus irregularis TaxID=588596 RepID=A0A2N1N720_9GLOM|nr:hypothetical protein RhiirC2_850558 [Rhizophagus irregularis]CAB4393651.1 unnamed protein product [Rhizophagus irregularis]CAB5387734.1 unnamed protein product [Rhizophagus irregularis]
MTSQQNLAIQSNSSKIENTIEGSDKSNMITIDVSNGNKSNQKRVLTTQEISKSFRIMAYRKSKRQIRGRYRRRSYTRIFWFIMFMLVFLSLIGAGIGGSLRSVGTRERWPEFVTFIISFTIIMYVYYKITEIVRWCFYWLAIATIILLIINKGSLVSEDKGFASTPEARILIIVLGAVECLTLFIWIIVRYVYPRIVKNAKWLDTIWWWRIKQESNVHIHDIHGRDAVGCFRYLAWESYSLWFRHGAVTYIGEVNANGRPHGRGEWVDDSFDGECLKGVWDDGVPVGPFQSRGSGTGDAFHAVRVGFVKNSHTPWNEQRLFPRPYQNGLDIAVASVECSVSGKYLKNLPKSTLILSPRSRESRDEETNKPIIENCLKNLMTFTSMEPDFDVEDATQSSVFIRAENDGFAITGFYPISTKTSRDEVIVKRVPKKNDSVHSEIEYTLEVNGWRPSVTSSSSNSSGCFRSSMECIIFIHGFNCPPKYATETLGQFLALGDFPSYIKPFVFSPPSANSLWYFGVKKQASSEQAINDFRLFLQDLRDAGFCAVHILSHSMGGMLTLQYAKAFEGIFQVRNSLDKDTRDTNIYSENEGTLMKLSTVTLLNPDAPLKQFISQGYARLNRYCDNITIYSNARDFPLKIGEIIWREECLGRQTKDLHHDGKLMNVDLIDTTQLDVNIHKVRHNFFNLNRLLVDDLRDIIVIKRRAKERRSRLSRKGRGVGLEGIVYTFLVAPSYVVNK